MVLAGRTLTSGGPVTAEVDLTTRLLDGGYEQFGPWQRITYSVASPAPGGLPPALAAPGGLPSAAASGGPFLIRGSDQHQDFRRIGHSPFALLAGLVGGFVARAFAAAGGPETHRPIDRSDME